VGTLTRKETIMRTIYTFSLVLFLAVVSLLFACAQQSTQSTEAQTANAARQEGSTAAATPSASPAPAVALDATKGQEIGAVYEAFLSPQQEPGEEQDTPASTPKQFQSSAPSQLRNERTARAHGLLRFAKDLSKVYVDVRVENVTVKDVNMFHIHCGRPDMLGPILVDFALGGDIQQNLADGTFSVVLTDADIEKTLQSAHGVTGQFLTGCPIVPGLQDKVKTIAGMEHIARQGELYFNLHTYGQTYYGMMRGQVRPQAAPTK
jgi:hypothetical protein